MTEGRSSQEQPQNVTLHVQEHRRYAGGLRVPCNGSNKTVTVRRGTTSVICKVCGQSVDLY